MSHFQVCWETIPSSVKGWRRKINHITTERFNWTKSWPFKNVIILWVILSQSMRRVCSIRFVPISVLSAVASFFLILFWFALEHWSCCFSVVAQSQWCLKRLINLVDLNDSRDSHQRSCTLHHPVWAIPSLLSNTGSWQGYPCESVRALLHLHFWNTVNESVCPGLCTQLKGSIKECFRGSTVSGRKFGSWCYGGKGQSKGKALWKTLWHGSIHMEITHYLTFCEHAGYITWENMNQVNNVNHRHWTCWQAVIKSNVAGLTFRAKYQLKLVFS